MRWVACPATLTVRSAWGGRKAQQLLHNFLPGEEVSSLDGSTARREIRGQRRKSARRWGLKGTVLRAVHNWTWDPRYHLTAQGGAGGLRLALKWKPGVEGGVAPRWGRSGPLSHWQSPLRRWPQAPAALEPAVGDKMAAWGDWGRPQVLAPRAPEGDGEGKMAAAPHRRAVGNHRLLLWRSPHRHKHGEDPAIHSPILRGHVAVAQYSSEPFSPLFWTQVMKPVSIPSGARPGRTSSSTSAELRCHLILRY